MLENSQIKNPFIKKFESHQYKQLIDTSKEFKESLLSYITKETIIRKLKEIAKNEKLNVSQQMTLKKTEKSKHELIIQIEKQVLKYKYRLKLEKIIGSNSFQFIDLLVESDSYRVVESLIGHNNIEPKVQTEIRRTYNIYVKQNKNTKG